MPRTTDASRREEARRLYRLDIPTARIARLVGVHRRTVQRWTGAKGTPRGPRKRPDVSDDAIREMRDEHQLSWQQIAADTGMSRSGVRHRYETATGGRPDRAGQGAAGGRQWPLRVREG